MSGMLVKEFLWFRRQAKVLLICLVFVLAVTAIFYQPQESSRKVLSYAVGAGSGLSVVFTLTIMAYEEKTKWNLFAKSFPLNSQAIVGARYVLMLCFTAVGAVFVLAAAVLFLGGKTSPEIWFYVWFGGWAVPLILCSVLLPLLYKFSPQKGILIFFLLVLIVPTFAVWLFWRSGVRLSQPSLLLLLRVSPLIVLVILGVSFFISCKIYSRKEL